MEYFGLSDIGKVRSQNQDYFYCKKSDSEGWCFLVVCDGMGGAKAGNVASELAAGIFSETFFDAMPAEYDVSLIDGAFAKALDAANSAVFDMSNSDYECRGMGTTLVAAFIKDNHCRIMNVGDSRAYLYSNGSLKQITVDHSYVQRLLDAGAINEFEAKNHPKRNVITRAVGTSDSVRGDIFGAELGKGDRLLLCSDGLINMTEHFEIEQVFNSGSSRQACESLVNLSLERGATDNTTVVVFDA